MDNRNTFLTIVGPGSLRSWTNPREGVPSASLHRKKRVTEFPMVSCIITLLPFRRPKPCVQKPPNTITSGIRFLHEFWVNIILQSIASKLPC
jgi:hypothetical protein